MKLRTSQLSTLALLAIIIGLAIGTLIARVPDANEQNQKAAEGVVRSWNAAVETFDAEDGNLHELLDSYKRNPPGRVLLTPDVRAAQKQRRLKLIEEIIRFHQARVERLRELASYEQALQ
ncbi:MAG: hypothetical protein ABJB61_15130 [bacterium]